MADETQWLGLDIVKTETLTKTQSAVEFKAHFQGNEQPQVHHEYSLFVKIDGRWYFVDPTVPLPAINSLVFVAQGRNLNIVAEACSNDLNVFSRIILAAFSRNKLTQAAGSLTYSTMLAIVPLIMVVFSIFSAFPVFNEVTGALKDSSSPISRLPRVMLWDNILMNSSVTPSK